MFIALLDYYVMLYFCDTLIHIMCNLITLYHTYIDFTWINLSIYVNLIFNICLKGIIQPWN